MVLSSLLSFVGSAISTTADVAGDALGAGADAATTVVTEGFSTLSENVVVDMDEVDQQTREILEGTEVEELQPEYIEGQLTGAGDDIQEAAQEVVVNPENSDQIIDDLGEQLSSRAEEIEQAVDEEAIANSVEENTDLTGAEAEEAAQNTVEAVEGTTQQAQEALDNAGNQLDQLRTDIDQAIQELRATADEATDTSAWTLVGLFIGHILMAVVSAYGGRAGSNLVKQSPREHRA